MDPLSAIALLVAFVSFVAGCSVLSKWGDRVLARPRRDPRADPSLRLHRDQ